VRCSEAMNNSLWMRRVIGVIVIVLLGVANVVDMVSPLSYVFPLFAYSLQQGMEHKFFENIRL